MIELFDRDKRDSNRKSSKGNQLKWERDGVWYKADYTGYEGLTEYVVSGLLEKSSLSKGEFVIYSQEDIRYKAQRYMGVSSSNFLQEGEQLITLERLFQSAFGSGLNSMVYGIESHADRLKLIVDKTQEITGLKNFGTYMSKLMAIDAFFLNEDRHSHNIAVILKADGTYRLCPIFDQGAGLLADTSMDYPLTGDTYELMKDVCAKTFCDDFDEQLEIAEKFYGNNLKLYFGKSDVDFILANAHGYEDIVIDRVRNIIYEQMRKYQYLF